MRHRSSVSEKSIHLKVSLCLLPPCLLLHIHNAAPMARTPAVIPDCEANLGQNPWYKEKELDLLMTLELLCWPCLWTFLLEKETVSYLQQYYRDLLLCVNKPIPAYKPLLYRNQSSSCHKTGFNKTVSSFSYVISSVLGVKSRALGMLSKC